MPLKDFTYWVDANLPPKTTGWLHHHFGVTAKHVYEMIGLLASDESFYLAAREEATVIILTKDVDFIKLQQQYGPPPKILGIAAGNLSNEELHHLLIHSFASLAQQLTDSDTAFIELNSP